MIDWGLQVLSAFQKSTSKTFFVFTHLLNTFLRHNSRRGMALTLDDFHLIGLTCIFMSSKLEDVVPI